MDPQQRLLLEVCWSALEDAGIDPVTLRGSSAGVFVGTASSGYGAGLERGVGVQGQLLTGGAASVTSGRVAYTLGLEGPAVSVDTACSSSLVALHLAAQSLRAGECSLALVGGVTVMATPVVFTEFSRQRGLAADGRCKSFADAADGTGWGEGVGVLVVERLSDARSRGHRVLAVVAGSAVNQDGASNGLTAPNGPSQQRVIRAALASAGLGAGQVDVVEAHGTGTTLGDPIEAQALIETYGQERAAGRGPLLVGSVKSNIGHAQAAAGVAGVIKMVAAIRHGVVPATLHVDAPSRHVDWLAGSVELVTEATPWPVTGEPRRAGVSSFGISGTNAHVILEQAPAQDEPVKGAVAGDGRGRGRQDDATRDSAAAADDGLVAATVPVVAWVVSARSAAGLRAQARRLAEFTAAEGEQLGLADVGWSLAVTRSALSQRAVVTGTSRDELLAGLEAVTAGEQVVTGAAEGGGARVVFVFPGQGSQWPAMAADLVESSPVFAARLAECAAVLDPLTGWPLVDTVCGRGADLGRVEVVQSALWAVMVSLAAVWQAAGVTPDAVVGHSQGEIAAAVVAGVLSLADGAKVVALRSQALAQLAGTGGMVSVAEPAGAVQQRLVAWDGRVHIAAVNGPAQVVVSGDAQALDELAAVCERDGVRARRVEVDYASHSPLVDQVRGQVQDALVGVTAQPGTVAMVSGISGDFVDGTVMDGGYWYRSLREPVQFHRAVQTLATRGHRIFIEVSPHPVLTPAIEDTLTDITTTSTASASTSTGTDAGIRTGVGAGGGAVSAAGPGAGSGVVVTGTLRRDDGGLDRLAASLAQVWVAGGAVDWSRWFPGPRNRLDLPVYAFQRQRYWPGRLAVGGDPADLGLAAAGHPLLGAAVELPGTGGVVLTGRLSLATHPWLADHQVAGNVLLPGAAFAELVIRAADEAGCGLVEELVLQAPLVLPERGGVQLRVSVGGSSDDGHRTAEVHSRHDDAGAGTPWTAHATATLAATAPSPAFDLAAWPPPGAQPVDVGGVYEALAGRGLGYGPAFRGLVSAWRRGDEVFAEAALPEAVPADGYGLHPALLDAALHAIGLHSSAGCSDDAGSMLPFAWSGVALHAAGAHVLRVRVTCTAPDTFSLQVADSVGSPVASVNSLMLRQVDPAALTGPGRLEWLFGVEWQPHEVAVAEHAAGSGVVVLGDGGLAGLGEVPPVVVSACSGGDGPVPAGTRAAVDNVLGLVQAWVADDRFASSRLVVVSRGAVAALAGEAVSDLAGAAVWGLVASAQAEHPGQVVLADTDAGLDERVLALIAAAAGDGEPRLAIRKGQALVPRLARARQQDVLAVPPGRGWRLEAAERGTLEALALASTGDVGDALETGQVRVDVRAAGVNFLDVFVALGLDPGQGRGLGAEGAGVVTATGPGVDGLAVGDAVMGIMPGAFGPVAVTDHRLLVNIPDGWSFAQAATVPVAFATAYYALVDLAGLRAGESVLIHAAAGGVGMAAVQIARYLGAEVYATASPGKWDVLAAAGLEAERIASSRDLGFEQAFRGATGGRGVDVVLDCLRGEFVDASLRLLATEGRFVEMGKTDIRAPHQVAADYGVSYQAFDLMDAGPERIGQILAELSALFGSAVLSALPRTVFDVRQARAALRWMSQAGHTGKIVLSIPQPLDRDGSVLVTGGTGTLGALTARHLATAHHVRHLILTSRRGPHAPGAAALAAGLARLGARVTVAACDVADRGALEGLLTRIAAEHQLTGVVHAAGVLDDALVGSLTPERADRVLAAKADAAWHLHDLTRDLDLGMFVLFSSAAGVLGSPGQGSYAAANAFLDGLAAWRQARGLAGVSVAWGLWEAASEMVGQSGTRVTARGVSGLAAAEGLALLDAALERGQAAVVAARLDAARLAGRGDAVPPLMSALVRSSGRGLAVGPQDGGGLAGRLAALPAGERAGVVAGLVRAHAAVVLGHGSAQDVDPGRAFRDLGFDSLTAVELRNRLGAVTGLRLPATVVFDYPTPAALAGFVLTQLTGEQASAAPAGTCAGTRSCW